MSPVYYVVTTYGAVKVHRAKGATRAPCRDLIVAVRPASFRASLGFWRAGHLEVLTHRTRCSTALFPPRSCLLLFCGDTPFLQLWRTHSAGRQTLCKTSRNIPPLIGPCSKTAWSVVILQHRSVEMLHRRQHELISHRVLDHRQAQVLVH